MRRVIGLLLVVTATACERAPDPAAAASSPEGAAAVIVYAPPAAEDRLRPALADYAAATGVRVDARYVGGLPDLVIDGRDAPHADLLVLAGAGDAVRSVDEGALRPVAKGTAEAEVPALLRDPDGSWLALAWEPAVIAYDVRRYGPDDFGDYAKLADPAFAGRLCLTSSSDESNLAVIAALVDDLGVRPAERVVRAWLANLSEPVFDSGSDLLAAIGAGRCSAGIVPGRYRSNSAGSTAIVRFATPASPAGDVLAAGVARHASHPAAALELLAWLATSAEFDGAVRDAVPEDYPALAVTVTGWLLGDARKLAERAGYR